MMAEASFSLSLPMFIFFGSARVTVPLFAELHSHVQLRSSYPWSIPIEPVRLRFQCSNLRDRRTRENKFRIIPAARCSISSTVTGKASCHSQCAALSQLPTAFCIFEPIGRALSKADKKEFDIVRRSIRHFPEISCQSDTANELVIPAACARSSRLAGDPCWLLIPTSPPRQVIVAL